MHHHRFVYYSASVKRVLSRNIGVPETLTDREFLAPRVRSITIRMTRSIVRSFDGWLSGAGS